jgi:hypothetical protein
MLGDVALGGGVGSLGGGSELPGGGVGSLGGGAGLLGGGVGLLGGGVGSLGGGVGLLGGVGSGGGGFGVEAGGFGVELPTPELGPLPPPPPHAVNAIAANRPASPFASRMFIIVMSCSHPSGARRIAELRDPRQTIFESFRLQLVM